MPVFQISCMHGTLEHRHIYNKTNLYFAQYMITNTVYMQIYILVQYITVEMLKTENGNMPGC